MGNVASKRKIFLFAACPHRRIRLRMQVAPILFELWLGRMHCDRIADALELARCHGPEAVPRGSIANAPRLFHSDCRVSAVTIFRGLGTRRGISPFVLPFHEDLK